MMKIAFRKMHGLGNDFVLLDNRDELFSLNINKIKILCDRHYGIGCDQLIIIENPEHPEADVFMRIYNADGHEAGACGNATRCLGYLLADEFKRPDCVIETKEGLLSTHRSDDGHVCVDMGAPRLTWDTIPLSHACETHHLSIEHGVLTAPDAVSMGNPHMVFFVPDVAGIDLHHVGQHLTHHTLYPQQANVEIVEIIDRSTIRIRVYERGAGVTLACGTGACASVVAACNRDLTDRYVKVILDGGILDIAYEETVKITGPVGFSFEGQFDRQLLEQEFEPWHPQQRPHHSNPQRTSN